MGARQEASRCVKDPDFFVALTVDSCEMDPDMWPPMCYAYDSENDACDSTEAIIVAPQYEMPIPTREEVNVELRSTIHQYLMDASVLPKSVSTAQKHVEELYNIIQNKGIRCTSIRHSVEATTKNVLDRLRCCAKTCRNGTVFMYFCGHEAGAAMVSDDTVHGHLLLRGAEKLAWEHIDAVLREENFTGTFVQVLNTCRAGHPIPMYVSSTRLQYSDVPPYTVIRLTSSTWHDSRMQDRGVEAGKEIVRFVRSQPPLPWSEWGEFFKVFRVPENVNIPSEFCAF